MRLNDKSTAGNKGISVRGDCFITFDPHLETEIDIQISSRVQSMFGIAIEALAKKVVQFYGIQRGVLTIEDAGAFDFVLAARLEACIRKACSSDRKFLPDMLPENLYSSNENRIRMSRLYVPGNTPKMMINAGIHKPHGVILDLEDSVAPDKKDEARILVRNALRQVDFYGAERMVRINQLPLGLVDLEEVAENNLHVVLVPKCESADDISQVNEKIDCIFGKRPISQKIFLVPIIESAKGVLNADKIACSADNIIGLSIGLEDYAADLGVTRSIEGQESFYARAHLVTVCKAFGIQAMGSVFSDVNDFEGLRNAAIRFKSLGFSGMSCIHPAQIKIVHEAFSPSNEEIVKAKGIVKASDLALESGDGVVALNGKMIDAPVVIQAHKVIHAATQLGLLSENWSEEDE